MLTWLFRDPYQLHPERAADDVTTDAANVFKEIADNMRAWDAALLFPQLLEPEVPPASAPDPQDAGLSCAELVARGEQGLFVNDLIASIAAQYLWRIVYRQPIHTFASFVDGDTLSVRSLPICSEELLAYLER